MNPAGITTMALEPSDLTFLKQVYENLCAERGLPGDTNAANELAASIIHLYQRGVRSQEALQSQLDAYAVGSN